MKKEILETRPNGKIAVRRDPFVRVHMDPPIDRPTYITDEKGINSDRIYFLKTEGDRKERLETAKRRFKKEMGKIAKQVPEEEIQRVEEAIVDVAEAEIARQNNDKTI